MLERTFTRDEEQIRTAFIMIISLGMFCFRSITLLNHGPSEGHGGLQVPSSQSRLNDCRWAAIHA